jgi:hypothetical protein
VSNLVESGDVAVVDANVERSLLVSRVHKAKSGLEEMEKPELICSD